jgi:hypothetical protein
MEAPVATEEVDQMAAAARPRPRSWDDEYLAQPTQASLAEEVYRLVEDGTMAPEADLEPAPAPRTRPWLARLAPSLQGLLIRLLFIAALSVALFAGLMTAVDWGRVWLDDWRYGRPRTTTLTAFVGHADGDGVPTTLMAVNLQRRIVIIELPGGDPAKIRTIVGPYLVGKDEELTTATMRVLDVNNDSHPDLLVRIKREELVYINDRGEFRLMNRNERPAVEKTLGGGAQ